MKIYTHLEDYVQKLYSNIGIYHPRQLSPEMISARLGIVVEYLPINSVQEGNTIILDSRISDTEQWQDFGHEMRHAIFDYGNQLKIPPLFKEYQEWKADNFSQYACVPTFMLEKLEMPQSESKAIHLIQVTFNVDYNFAKKRLHQYMKNSISIS